MIKPTLPENETERLNALRQYNVMDSLPEEDYDNITRIASEICQMPVSLITIIDSDRQWFKSKQGTELTDTPLDLSFCAHGMSNPHEPLIVSDATVDPRFINNPLLEGELKLRFYAGVSLVDSEGFVLGSLCVIDSKKNQLNSSQIETLKILANQVVRLLQLRKTIFQLEKAQDDLVKGNNNLKEFAYIISHDLKAPVRNMKHLTEVVLEDYADQLDEKCGVYLKLINDQGKDAISLIEGVLNYSKVIHSISDKQELVNLNDLLASLIKNTSYPSHLTIKVTNDFPQMKTSDVAMRQIFSNLIDNAVKYNDKKDGWVNLNYLSTEDHHVFQVEDNGRGISKEQIASVFTLFYRIDGAKGRGEDNYGIGLSIVKKMALELGGEINVNSLLGEKSVFEVKIPK